MPRCLTSLTHSPGHQQVQTRRGKDNSQTFPTALRDPSPRPAAGQILKTF